MDNKELEQAYRDHFKHMCSTGYDPLLCINRSLRFIKLTPKLMNGTITDFSLSKNNTFKVVEKTEFIDRVITEDRYVELLASSNVSKDKLDDIIFLDIDSFIPRAEYVVAGNAALFWLYPSGCRTLSDFYKKYEKKIKDELRHMIIK